MSALGMKTTLLATGLAEAYAKDEAEAKDETIDDRGFDLSAGMFGRHVSAWLREVAAALAANVMAGQVAYQLTKRIVIDLPTARAAVDAAIKEATA